MVDRELLSERLNKAYEYLLSVGKIHNKQDLAEAIGKTRADVSNALASRGRVMTLGLLKRVADAFPEVLNRDYLLDGEGEIAAPDKSLRPHFPAKVEAGVLSGDLTRVMDYDVDMEPAIKRFPFYDYMIDVNGHSMEPTYHEGDSVACRRIYDRDEITPGKVYVFATREGAVLKRFVSSSSSAIRVESDNPDFHPYDIPSEAILSIAEVVGFISCRQPSITYIREELLKFAKALADQKG